MEICQAEQDLVREVQKCKLEIFKRTLEEDNVRSLAFFLLIRQSEWVGDFFLACFLALLIYYSYFITNYYYYDYQHMFPSAF